jgi:actin-related protein
MEIMFELFEVPSLLLADQLEMSLYALGLLTAWWLTPAMA